MENFLSNMGALFENVTNITWQMVVMWIIGAILIYLAIKKEMEPSLLLPMGFGVILVNLPLSGAITQGNRRRSFKRLVQLPVLPTSYFRCCFLSVSVQ